MGIDGGNKLKNIVFGIGDEVRLKYSNSFIEKIDCFVDNDKAKWGKIYCGKPVCEPSEELLNRDNFIIVSSLMCYNEIKRQLAGYGLIEGCNFVWGPNWYGNETLPSTYGYKEWKAYDNIIDFSYGRWDYRVKTVAELIPEEVSSVMDLGAGAMSIRQYLGEDVKYFPVDYCKRSEETVVCDMENHEFPDIKTDCIVASGIIEYMSDVKWFVDSICGACDTAVISYIPIEKMGDYFIRQHEGWKNNLMIMDLCRMFLDNGFEPVEERMCYGNDLIIRFERK